jgi:hypothetical protein
VGIKSPGNLGSIIPAAASESAVGKKTCAQRYAGFALDGNDWDGIMPAAANEWTWSMLARSPMASTEPVRRISRRRNPSLCWMADLLIRPAV